MSVIKYDLKTPIVVSGNEIKTIKLEEPDFDLMAELGLPSDLEDQKERLELIRTYIARCSSLSEEAIGKLKVRDSVALLTQLLGFFRDTP